MEKRSKVDLLFLTAFVLCSVFSKAQIVMKNSGSTTQSVTIIKYNVAALAASDYVISCERKVAEKFSCELGAGLTYRNDILEDFGMFDPKPKDYFRKYRTSKPGYSGRVTAKYYFNPKEESLNGFFAGAELMYRRYNTTGENEYLNPSLYSEYNDQKEIRGLFGWEMDIGNGTRMNLPMTLEYVVGVGYRIQERKYLSEENPDYMGDEKIKTWVKKFPVPYFGIKVGFAISELF